MNIIFVSVKQLCGAVLLLLVAASGAYCQTGGLDASSVAQSYDGLIKEARALMNESKLPEAKAKADEAARLDPRRYEAFAVAALIAVRQDDSGGAKSALGRALELAPPEKKASLEALGKRLAEPPAPTSAQSLAVPPETAKSAATPPQLKGDAGRKYDALLLIIEDADKASSAEERARLLREFMARSADFLALAPTQTNIWFIRGAAAVELDYPGAGWLIGRRLKEFGLEDSDDPAVRKVMASLDRRGWLGKERIFRDWIKRTTEQIKASATAGDEEDQRALGYWYENGQGGLPKDDSEAVKWYRKAAEQGDADGQNDLGRMYYNGRGVAKDEAEAVKWYQKAAEQGHGWAENNLGWMYATGTGVAKDENEAAKWHRKAAEQGNPSAQGNLGWMYANGRGVVKDETESLKWYRLAAEAGDSKAQLDIGIMYLDGKGGVARDREEALKWLRKPFQAGLTNLTFNIQGEGAADSWQVLAKAGYPDAQFKLGELYRLGRGVTMDETEAAKWFRKAAEAGNPDAQNNLGAAYLTGQGVPKDESEAVKWFRKAAEAGHASPQYQEAQQAVERRRQEQAAKAAEDLARAKQAAAERITESVSARIRATTSVALGKWKLSTDSGTGFIELTRDSSGRLLCHGKISVKDRNRTIQAEISSIGSPDISTTARQQFRDDIAKADTLQTLEATASSCGEAAAAEPVVAELHGKFTWKTRKEKTETSPWAMLRLTVGLDHQIRLSIPTRAVQQFYFGAVKVRNVANWDLYLERARP
jgi:TPR repeat protein